MTIHLSLYPNFENAIHLTIKYIPAMDKQEIKGIWDVDTNQVALDWQLFKEFQRLEEQVDKRKFFEQLHKVSRVQLEQK